MSCCIFDGRCFEFAKVKTGDDGDWLDEPPKWLSENPDMYVSRSVIIKDDSIGVNIANVKDGTDIYIPNGTIVLKLDDALLLIFENGRTILYSF